MADENVGKRDLTAGVPLSEFDTNSLVAGMAGDDEVLMVKGASGIFAVGATCTHSGAPLAKGIVVGDTVRCPWHHACFDAASGTAVAAPAFKPLRRWTVEQRDGRAFVSFGLRRPLAAPLTTAERIVIVGAGAGGSAAADALAAMGAGAATTLIGNEVEPPYDRTALSKAYLKGKLDGGKLALKLDSLAQRGVDVRLGASVEAVQPEGKVVHLADGTTLPFTKLILATGGEARRLRVPGAGLPHVHLLRSVADARRILGKLGGGKRAVVIGGGFVGFEGAAAFRDQGVAVTVVTSDEHPFRAALGTDLAGAILDIHRRKGTTVRLGAQVARIEPDSVILADGTAVPADIVLVGIGIAPRIELAETAGLRIDDGIVVDERLRTSDRSIFAIGDIARWPDPHSGKAIRVEHWAVAQRQGQVAAMNALGHNQRYDVVPFFWTAHFDLSVRYVGHAGKDAETTVEGNLSQKNGLVRYRENGREVAVATVGRDRDSLAAERAMERRLGERAACLPVPVPEAA